MKLTNYSDMEVQEQDADDDSVVIRCPECGALWLDEADPYHPTPKQPCGHLRFTLCLQTGEMGDGSRLDVQGEWDSREFRAAVENAFRRTTRNWQNRLRRITCPGIDEVIFYDDELLGCIQTVVGNIVWAFGFSRQKGGAVVDAT
jgi:hypothetical protein